MASASIAMTNLWTCRSGPKAAAAALVGTACDEAAIEAAVKAMLADIDPVEDNRGPVEFKKQVAGTVLRRAIARAWSRV